MPMHPSVQYLRSSFEVQGAKQIVALINWLSVYSADTVDVPGRVLKARFHSLKFIELPLKHFYHKKFVGLE